MPSDGKYKTWRLNFNKIILMIYYYIILLPIEILFTYTFKLAWKPFVKFLNIFSPTFQIHNDKNVIIFILCGYTVYHTQFYTYTKYIILSYAPTPATGPVRRIQLYYYVFYIIVLGGISLFA